MVEILEGGKERERDVERGAWRRDEYFEDVLVSINGMEMLGSWILVGYIRECSRWLETESQKRKDGYGGSDADLYRRKCT